MKLSTVYLGFFIIFLIALFIRRITKWLVASKVYKKLFSALMSSWAKYPTPSEALRQKLLAQLVDKLFEGGGDVLEIGVGVGSNLKYMDLPEGSSYIAVDFNPNMESYLRENLRRLPEKNIQLKQFIAEDACNMRSVADNSVTAVLATQILCSIEEEKVQEVLSEIKRVLKPGGCYFFLEHIIDEPGTIMRQLQNLSCLGGFLPLLIEGCTMNKETWKSIQEAGFQKVAYQKCYIPYFFSWRCLVLSGLRYLTRLKIYGYAMKR